MNINERIWKNDIAKINSVCHKSLDYDLGIPNCANGKRSKLLETKLPVELNWFNLVKLY